VKVAGEKVALRLFLIHAFGDWFVDILPNFRRNSIKIPSKTQTLAQDSEKWLLET
jgi:hypothetical protein